MVPQKPDLVVIGAGITGVLAALLAKARGRSVALVEKRSYPGWEVAAHNHSFVSPGRGDGDLRRIPPALAPLFQFRTGHGDLLVSEGFARTTLLTVLEEAGIPVLFEAEVAEVVGDGMDLSLTLATPSGLLALAAPFILDATDRHAVCRRAMGLPYIESEVVDLRSCFEMTRQAPWDFLSLEKASMNMDSHIPGFLPGSLDFHPTLRSDTVNVTCALRVEADGAPFRCRTRLEMLGKNHCLSVAAHLRAHHHEFAVANLSHLGFETRVVSNEGKVIPSPYPNLLAGPLLPWGFSLTDVVNASDTLANQLDTMKVPDALHGGSRAKPESRGTAIPFDDDGMSLSLQRLSESPTPGAVFNADICVAGIGAGGGLAMVAALESGLRVAAIEVNRDFGGTHTLGRVSGYYHGYRGGMNKSLEDESEKALAPVTDQSGSGGLGHAAILMDKARSGEADVFTGTRVVGAVMDGNRLHQVLAANEDGLFAIQAPVTIDTTGDADVAAHAGVDFAVGDPRDGMVQTYSMWGVEPMPTASWLSQRYYTDPDIIHPHVYSERIRAIHHGHRGNSPFHISPMVTVRESRRIAGEHTLSLAEILSTETPADTIAVGVTPADSHAYTSSDLALMGHVGSEVPLQARIPYGCFLPRGIDGLLVGSKALSGERDATSFCRMNADIKHAGYALGRAAAMAVAGNLKLRDIPLGDLQQELKAKGVLPAWTFQSVKAPEPVELVEKLMSLGLPAMESIFHEPSGRMRPALERKWASLGGATATHGDLLAQCLAWHGSDLGAPAIAEQIRAIIREGRHLSPPVLRAPRGHIVTRLAGADDHSTVTRLVMAAGRSRSRAVVPAMAELLRETPGPGKRLRFPMPYDENRRDIVGRPFYARLLALATAVEYLACPELAAPMETVLDRPGVSGHAVPLGTWAVPDYMSAHLEVRLARAALRCGSPVGREILSSYLDDTHCFFRKHAMLEMMKTPSLPGAIPAKPAMAS